MQLDSVLYEQYAKRSIRNSEPISPLRTSVDPRFSSLLIRAANYRERTSQPQVSPTDRAQSPSVVTRNSNAWLPTETPNKKSINIEKKSCLSPVWKARLQGLLVGLAIAAISTGTTLGVLLTRPSADSTTSTSTSTSTSTTTTAPPCSSLQWDPISVVAAGNGTSGSASNEFNYPWGVYVDSNNTLYVADYNNHRIQQWLPNAVSGTTVAGVTGIPGSNGSLLNGPTAVYGDSQQNLYIADSNGISVWPLGASVGTQILGSTGLGNIYAIFVDKNGNLYASATLNCAVVMWTPTATASTLVAGGTGCGYSSSQLYLTLGFTVDSLTNTIYAANYYSHTIVAWPVGGTNGTITAGLNSTYGAADILLYYPHDVKCDQYGNLYVVDTNNNRVLLFCQNPPSTIGSIIAGYELSGPISIALDSALNLYVTDTGNNQVQKYTRIV